MEMHELLTILEAINKPKIEEEIGGDVKIVVLQRGWIAVGRYYRKGDECRLENAYIIRRWGTSKGLPELANMGPLENTILDKAIKPIEFHRLTEVLVQDCIQEKWNRICPKR